ncbi:MAG: hypothetical protein C0518_01350 [Opitutus sp.]|nr:hypothetical protein [Opitutus sp.]
MLSEFLQDRAALYVSGNLPAAEHDAFQVLLEFDPELRSHVAALEEAVNVAAVAEAPPPTRPPSPDLKARILAAAENAPQQTGRDAMVVTDGDGRVVWVNEEFTALCGFALDELKGRKPGQLLQGPDTDPATVARIREAVRARCACREEIVNYHKNGARYCADVRISPVLDDAGEPVWFVARERLVAAG